MEPKDIENPVAEQDHRAQTQAEKQQLFDAFALEMVEIIKSRRMPLLRKLKESVKKGYKLKAGLEHAFDNLPSEQVFKEGIFLLDKKSTLSSSQRHGVHIMFWDAYEIYQKNHGLDKKEKETNTPG